MNLSKYFTLLFVLMLAIIPQMFWGNIDLQMFVFPINVALLFALSGSVYVFFREKQHWAILRWLGSARISVFLIAFLCVCALIIAFVPHLCFQHSWIFNFALLLLLVNLQLAIHFYKGRFSIRFYLTHVGLFIFIASLSLGSADTEKLRTMIYEGNSSASAYDYSGRLHPVSSALTLEKFDISYYDNGVPESFKATVSSDQIEHEILVNHPWHRSWCEDIYLVSHGIDAQTHIAYCVFEIIRQPWIWLVRLGLMLTMLGSFLLLWGKKSIR